MFEVGRLGQIAEGRQAMALGLARRRRGGAGAQGSERVRHAAIVADRPGRRRISRSAAVP